MKYGNLQLVIIKIEQNFEKVSFLEKKLKNLEQNLNNEETKLRYNNLKDELNDIHEEISNGIKIRSRCNWCELGETNY